MRSNFQSKYFKWGLTVFLTAAAIIVFFFAIFRYQGVGGYISSLLRILRPFIYGTVLAFLVSPLYNWSQRFFERLTWPSRKDKQVSSSAARILATLISLATIILAIGALLWLIIPQLIQSITNIAKETPEYIANMSTLLDTLLDSMPAFAQQVEEFFSSLGLSFSVWVQEEFLPSYDLILANISEQVIGIARAIFNFLVGLVVCAFFLNSKEVFLAQSKKLVLAIFREEAADNILRGAAFVSKTFWAFITGKVLDSLIIGVLCFIFMSIFSWPYAALISVIIGICNIIPFFGPFLGAVPSALLLLMVSPRLCLFFILFVLALQQFDGNILGPKILGETIGLSSFWILFAIIVAGGIWGFLGMLFGVPVFAVIYAYTCFAVNRRLKKKGLSTDLRDYKTLYKFSDGVTDPRAVEKQKEEAEEKARQEQAAK